MERSVRALALAACLMLTVALAPVATAQTAEGGDDGYTENDPLTWGLEYDWSNLEEDVEVMTSIPMRDIIDDVSEAADYAGFNLTYVQVSTGSSLVYVEQWEGEEITTVTDADGDDHYVNERYTALTLRHGILFDAAVLGDWEDDGETIEATVSADYEEMYILDILYTEYVTADLEIVGADMSLSGEAMINAGGGFDAVIEAGGETIDWDVEVSGALGYEIEDLDVQMRLYEPEGIYESISAGGEDIGFACNVHMEQNSYGDCGVITGSFSTSVSYEVEISGLPAHELDLAADAFDLSISDTYSDSGSFEEDFEYFTDFEDAGESLSVVVDNDGNTLEVDAMYALPLTPGMFDVLAHGVVYAVEGSPGTTHLGDVLEDEFEAWAADIEDEVEGSEEGDDVYICDDGEEIPADWVNDGEEDCMDGSDEGVEDWQEDDSPASAFEAKIETMGEALEASNLEKTMEAFGEKLERLLSDYEAVVPYEDGAAFALWSDEEARFVGGMVLVEDNAGQIYNFLGPETSDYADAPDQISLAYLTGAAAALAEEEAETEVTLASLAPATEHDTSAVREALGETADPENPVPIDVISDEEGNVIPAAGALATLSILGAAALAGRRRPEL